ncbi:P-loop containing nucleoside triphosphate hydrolase [Pseudocohnilembus persalinus]|uniref:p-loop containing nucleoside triphosphate hydrolase n=1 Tax=Pseudocohnilembus persalinus TaxID=266149 RepID=A0A0V0QMI9_PSEPJ|nr:P-loop containing nucleoside triphosphate hydrolase [Pseudocohnilembus persalinus]|eukprot:KRX03386.1 P-loop containing nucleoside triphosphate hydrolase [Pseudocohnilembus persalinus]
MSQPQEVKIVMLGDAGVGKSSILLRFVTNDFQEDKESTLGAAFLAKNLTVNDINYKFQIWDTAGQEKYKSLVPLYYKDASVAIIVYDITKQASFDVLRNWVDELKNQAPKDQIIAVVGNKLDLIDDDCVPYEEVKIYARDINAIFKLTSAKSNQNITDLFEDIAKKLQEQKFEQLQNKKQNQKLDNKKKGNKKKGCC